MRKRMRGFVAFMLAAVMVCAMLPGMAVTARAATVVKEGDCGVSGSNIKYRITSKGDGTYHLEISGKGYMQDYTQLDIPAPWFREDDGVNYKNSITSVTVTKGVKSIGNYAFYGPNLPNLKSITLAEGIEKLGTFALAGLPSSVKQLRLPSTITSIGSVALGGLKLSELTLPKDLSEVGQQATEYFAVDKIYYPGTEAEYDKIDIHPAWNEALLKENIIFGKAGPSYGSEGDTEPTFNKNPDLPSGGDFSDVPNDSYFKPAVDWAVSKGVTAGVDDGSIFGVGRPLTRGQAATFLYAFDGKGKTDGGPSFTDVEQGKWYTVPVLWMAANGYTKGYDDGRFGHSDNVTRAQALTFIRAMAKGSGGSANFTDVKSGSWQYPAVAWAASNGILNGVPYSTSGGRFYPDNECTREEFVTFLYNYSKK